MEGAKGTSKAQSEGDKSNLKSSKWMGRELLQKLEDEGAKVTLGAQREGNKSNFVRSKVRSAKIRELPYDRQ